MSSAFNIDFSIEAWQIALEVERIEGRYVTVFIPGAPNPWSGDVLIFAEDRIKPLDIPLAAAVKSLRLIGKGAGKLAQSHLP